MIKNRVGVSASVSNVKNIALWSQQVHNNCNSTGVWVLTPDYLGGYYYDR